MVQDLLVGPKVSQLILDQIGSFKQKLSNCNVFLITVIKFSLFVILLFDYAWFYTMLTYNSIYLLRITSIIDYKKN